MSELKHTPGPWHAETAPCGTRVGLMGGSGLEPVAMLGVKTALNPANVRLIEAAPDLLGALEAALPLVQLLGAKMNNPQQVADTTELIFAALTKAKGE